MRVVPFKIHVPEERLIDLRDRLSRVRWPASLDEAGGRTARRWRSCTGSSRIGATASIGVSRKRG
jgi:hypothetical protein